jgi:hypothetical protein
VTAAPQTSTAARDENPPGGVSFQSAADLCGVSASALKKVYHWTGTTMDTDAWLDGRLQAERTEACTRIIAAKLASVGVSVRRPEKDGTLHRVGLVSGKSEAITPWRHQVFLPAVARSERHGLIRDFTYWSEIKGNEHLRYFVATSGERCAVSDLPDRFAKLHSSLSDLKRSRHFKPGGALASVSFVLRTDEFTMKRDAEFPQGVSFHPHSNIIIHTPEFLGPDRFRLLRALVNHAFNAHVGPIEPVRSIKEVVKYVCKYTSDAKNPGELGIQDIAPELLLALYNLRAGMKPVQCLGPFRDFRRHLEEKRLKVSQMPDKGGKRYLAVIPREAPKERGPSQLVKRRDVILCVTDPAPSLSPMFEPTVIVSNYSGTLDGLLFSGNTPQPLHTLRDFAIAAAEHNRAAAALAAAKRHISEVHTFTETSHKPQAVVACADTDPNLLYAGRPPDP